MELVVKDAVVTIEPKDLNKETVILKNAIVVTKTKDTIKIKLFKNLQ